MTWLHALLPHLKALHVAALPIWCAGILAVPVMLARHDPAIGQEDYARVRRASHYAYTFAVTPAAVLAIASGTALVFVREVYAPWMLLKLAVVALLVGFHAWVGHTLVAAAETEGRHDPPRPAPTRSGRSSRPSCRWARSWPWSSPSPSWVSCRSPLGSWSRWAVGSPSTCPGGDRRRACPHATRSRSPPARRGPTA